MEQTDINILNESKKNDHVYTAVPQIDRTQKIGLSPIIRTYELGKMLHIKYNGTIYSRQVTGKFKTLMKILLFLHINTLENYFTPPQF